MALFNEGRSKDEIVGRARMHFPSREKDFEEENPEGDSMMTSRDNSPQRRHRRITSPNTGKSYHWRGQAGKPSQWLEVPRADYAWLDDMENVEVKRDW